MTIITDVKRRIDELSAANFQEFCDTLISRCGYGDVYGLGMKAGTGKTTKGVPDSYIRKDDGKYILICYTTNHDNIYKKLKGDIEDALDSDKTGLNISEIEEIICCHTSSNLSAGNDKSLHDICESQGINLKIWGINELANIVYTKYKTLAKDYLNISIDTLQILSVDEFINEYDSNQITAPINTQFQYRQKEKTELLNLLSNNDYIIVYGKPGVGKTRLVLEVAQEFCKSNNYNLLCVKSNGLCVYEDLVSATEDEGEYLFFIDDANELLNFNHVLEYTKKSDKNKNFKIILTVRDYAKDDIRKSSVEYVTPKEMEITTFSDDEIKGFIECNLGIRNHEYLNQIIRIAEGNPRVAYMAGRLALKEENLISIYNVSNLYEEYYAKYISNTIGIDKNLSFTAGILSVINAVDLNDTSIINEILEEFGMTDKELIDNINRLYKMEVIEIHYSRVAKISDQSFSNYMLYYVFIEEKFFSLSKLLNIGYKSFRNKILISLSTITNLFHSTDTLNYLNEEILKVWDKYKEEDSEYLDDFIIDFHQLRPEVGFTRALEKIDLINEEEFNPVETNIKGFRLSLENNILGLLSGFNKSEDINTALEILLLYANKSERCFLEAYDCLVNNYGIKGDDYRYKFFKQLTISKYLFDNINKDLVTTSIGFNWAKFSLSFSFSSIKGGRKGTFNYQEFSLECTDEIKNYRDICWQIIINLADDDNWRENIIVFLQEYSSNLNSSVNEYVLFNDLEDVDKLFKKICCDKISFMEPVHSIMTTLEKRNIRYNENWNNYLGNEKWGIYKLLCYERFRHGIPYEENVKRKQTEIIEYSNNLKINELNNFVYNLNSILEEEYINKDDYFINQNLELLIQNLDIELLEEFLYQIINYGKNINLNPIILLDFLKCSNNYVKLLDYIKESNSPQKNKWMFCYFQVLPKSEITEDTLNELFQFLEDDSYSTVTGEPLRSLRILDKFKDIDPDIYPKACSVIYNKTSYSEFIAKLYFKLLFSDEHYSPDEVLDLFKTNIEILQDIYFFTLSKFEYTDYYGSFINKFLNLDESWLAKYSDALWENYIGNSNRHIYNIKNVWKSDKYIEIIDYIFDNTPQSDSIMKTRVDYFLNNILDTSEDELVLINQREWIKHIIETNANTDRIVEIFDIVSGLDDETRRISFKTFLEINSDFDTFNLLYLGKRQWSGWGGFDKFHEEQSEFLKSILPIVTGIRFIKHKSKIQSLIENHEKRRKEERVHEILNDSFL